MSDSSQKEKRETYVSPPVPYDFGSKELLGNPALDNVVTCMVAMAAEMWASKRRLTVLEAVLQEHGVPADAVATYVPTAEQEAEWATERDRFIELALGPMADSSFRPFSSDDNGFTRF